MTPLYKSGERFSLDNYRPISVLNILSKVVERIAYMQIIEYPEKNNLLTPFKYGFRRHRSTKHAVIKCVDHIREHMDKRQLTGALFMDFRKAFNIVNHARLLHKLPFYGILDNELSWLSNYLFNRSHCCHIYTIYKFINKIIFFIYKKPFNP